jgi:hypothetical protein
MQKVQQSIVKPNRPLRRVLAIIKHDFSFIVLTFLNLVILIILSEHKAIYIPVNHLDGAFQTASGLFRIAQGQIPGVDFFPYLGIGPLLMLFPVFFVSGGDLSSSVFASHFITYLILQIIIGITYFFLKKNSNYKEVIIAAISLFYVYTFVIPRLPINADIASLIGLNALSELSQPGNSLRPIRAFSIWITVLVLFLLSARISSIRKANLVSGSFIALIGTLWSNDYALVAMIVGFAIVLSSKLKSKKICKSCFIEIVGSFIAVLTVILYIFNANGWRNSFFAYNYLDVRLDQFWYFGPWGNQFRILDFQDFLTYFWKDGLMFPGVVLLVLLVRVVYLKQLKDISLLMIGLGLFLGGSLATIGGHIYIYYHPFKLWGFLVACNFVLLAIHRKMSATSRQKAKREIEKDLKIPSRLVCVTLICILFQVTNTFLKEQQLASANENYSYHEKFGGFLDKNFVPEDLPSKIEQRDFLEEYYGLESAMYGFKQVNKVDSVIHALGKQRLDFQKSILLKPGRVITSSPEVGDWFAWNISANWWFYRVLFTDYSAELNTPLTLKWVRKDRIEWPAVDCVVKDMGRAIEIKPTDNDFYEVELRYKNGKSGQREFSMIQNNLNIVQSPGAYLALDPGQKTQSFPVAGFAAVTKLKLVDVGKSSTAVTKITSCNAKKIAFGSAGETKEILESLIRPSSSPANFSDQNWDSGVSKVFAGFFVRDRPANHNLFKIGEMLKFANGDKRTITDLTFIEGYINVFLDGELLNPEQYGYPNKFRVEDK